jgi:MFS family permease
MRLLKHPFVLVLFIVTFIDAAVHQYYFVWTDRYLRQVGIPGNWVMPVMSIGQVAEIATLAVLGYVLKGLGWKWTMIVGILGHAARFAVFAFLPDPYLAVIVNVLHGICYAFFFATVYIFVDEFFPKDARSSAQGLFNALILGVGPLATNFVAPWLGALFETGKEIYDFRMIFLVPMVAALIAAGLLLVFFNPPRRAEVKDEPLPAFDDGGLKAAGPGLAGASDKVTEPGKVTAPH